MQAALRDEALIVAWRNKKIETRGAAYFYFRVGQRPGDGDGVGFHDTAERDPGLAREGLLVYRANGCAYCHSQQMRQSGATFRLAPIETPVCHMAVVSDPDDYGRVLDHLKDHGGSTSLEMRLDLARKAFRLLSRNDAAIADYLDRLEVDAVRAAYEEVK